MDERGINNSVVLLTPPVLSLIGTSYMELPRSCVRCHVTAHVTSATTVQLFQHSFCSFLTYNKGINFD